MTKLANFSWKSDKCSKVHKQFGSDSFIPLKSKNALLEFWEVNFLDCITCTSGSLIDSAYWLVLQTVADWLGEAAKWGSVHKFALCWNFLDVML